MIEEKSLEKISKLTENNEHTKAREFLIDAVKPIIGKALHSNLRIGYQVIRTEHERLGYLSEGLIQARQGWDKHVFEVLKEKLSPEDYQELMKCI